MEKKAEQCNILGARMNIGENNSFILSLDLTLQILKKMNVKHLNKIALLLLVVLTVFSSCSKEEVAPIIQPEQTEEGPASIIEVNKSKDRFGETETGEEVKIGFRMNINGSLLESNAVAAYCQTDSSEFIMVANKEVNLSFPMQTENFAEGDFVYFTSISEAATWAYGGQALGESLTGFPGLSIFFSDATIEIESNDGQTVVGSSEGTLVGIDANGDFVEIPYSMDFVANIVQVSDFCD